MREPRKRTRIELINVWFENGHCLIKLLITVILYLAPSSSGAVQDPRLIVYPGDVNIALIVNSHKSSKPGVCSDSINLEQLRATMTALWSIHQINTNRANNSSIRLGLYVYDTCSDVEISERQVVRLLGHLDDIQSASCSKEHREAPLIGVVSSGEILGSSLHLLTSFQVPIISIDELDPMHSPRSTLFTVASSLKYLSKAVVGLLNKLNWSQATLVVSDEVPLYYTKILEEISLKVRFNVQNSPSSSSSDGKSSKPNHILSSQSPAVKNTILFLSPDESLKLFSSLRSQSAPEAGDLDWIVVTSRDIRSQLRNMYSNSKDCHTKPMYLILPQQEKVPELGAFLERELQLMGDTRDTVFKELLAMANSLSANSSIPETFSSMIKAISSYNLAVQNYESKYCDPDDQNGRECIRGMGSNLVSMIMNEIKLLNESVYQPNFQSLDGFRINFDEEHYLTSNRYGLVAINQHCELVQMGHFVDGILINESEKPQERGNQEDSMQSNLSSNLNHITLVPSESAYFESERTNKNKVNPHRQYRNKTVPKKSSVRSMVKNVPLESVFKLRPVPRSDGHSREATTGRQDKSMAGRSADPRPSSKFVREASKQNIASLPNQPDYLRRRFTSFFSWLGWAWTVAIVSLSAVGILVALYTFTYILMKSCEGALKNSNQDMATFHLLAIIVVYFSSVLYIFPPSVMMCSARASLHNISLIMLFASLLQRGLNLRAQKWIGLGGKVSKLNQCFTMLFIIGIQVALEVQRWSYEEPWIHEGSSKLQSECTPKARQFILSQVYLLTIVLLLVLISFSARKQPFAFKDGKHVFLTSMLVFPMFLASIILVDNYTDPELSSSLINSTLINRAIRDRHTTRHQENLLYHYATLRDIISSLSMILMASTSLLCIFGPIIYTIHKYGILPPKSGSYAESLSTAFTLFRGLDHHDGTLLEQASALDSSSDAHSVAVKARNKAGKNRTLFAAVPPPHLKFGLKPGSWERSCPFNHCRNHLKCTFPDCNHLDRSGLIRNPLYDEKNFKSAYP